MRIVLGKLENNVDEIQAYIKELGLFIYEDAYLKEEKSILISESEEEVAFFEYVGGNFILMPSENNSNKAITRPLDYLRMRLDDLL